MRWCGRSVDVIGLLVLVAVVLATVAIGLWRRRADGRLRPVAQPAGGADTSARDLLTEDDLGAPLGNRATLVQFSSAFCAPCRATRTVLGEVSTMLPGIAHVEVDAESRLDLVRRLDVRRTPTVLVLDDAGRVRTRASGAPRKADVVAALGEFL